MTKKKDVFKLKSPVTIFDCSGCVNLKGMNDCEFGFPVVDGVCDKKHIPGKGGKKYDGWDGIGEKKLMYHLIPPEPIEHLARIYTHGASKYGPNQWQGVRPFYERYYDALKRHLEADRKGEVRDADSGEFHLAHALWNLNALLWMRIQEEKVRVAAEKLEEAKSRGEI